MALCNVIRRMRTGTYTVTRTAAGAYVDGRYTPGATTTFEIVASIQPVSGRDLQVLPEGQYASETRVVYTETPLLTRAPEHDPDRLTIGGEQWDVFRVEQWEAFRENQRGDHCRAYISRRPVP